MRRRGRIRTVLGLLLAILIALPGDPTSGRPSGSGLPVGASSGRLPGKSIKAAVFGVASDTPTPFIEEDGEADDDLDAKALPVDLAADLHNLPDLRAVGDATPTFRPAHDDGRSCLRRSSRLRF